MEKKNWKFWLLSIVIVGGIGAIAGTEITVFFDGMEDFLVPAMWCGFGLWILAALLLLAYGFIGREEDVLLLGVMILFLASISLGGIYKPYLKPYASILNMFGWLVLFWSVIYTHPIVRKWREKGEEGLPNTEI